jgi:biofilm PGA synthesis N-glycosyltransferase PgaC
MNISVGILAHNEEKNIGRLLESVLKQRLNEVSIKEIFVVSSGSTDKTDKIVSSYCEKHNNIQLIIQKERKGKYSAINQFLKRAKSNIIVQISADVLPDKCALEALCQPLSDPAVGMVGGHSIPINKPINFMGFLVNFQWQMHHEVNLLRPKFGELIAFRRVFDYLPPNSVDEEYIASIIRNKGFKQVYAPNSVVFNKGPEHFKDFIVQRRRIHSGHLFLHKKTNYTPSSMQTGLVLQAALKSIPKYKKHIHWVILAALAEVYVRLLGMYDCHIKKRDSIVWDVAQTAKIK